MQYGKYYERISIIANILGTIRRFRVLILSVIAVCVALTSGYIGMQGFVYEETPCPEALEYGETLSYQAGAAFQSVEYEYALDSSFEQVLEAPPKLPGSYYVRAVSTSFFGKPTYGKVQSFTIQPKVVDVTVREQQILYGETPTVTATLYGEDTIFCDGFAYEDLSKTATKVTPLASAVVIRDEQGNDITNAYQLNFVTSEISFVPREITVTVSGAENIYNGLPFSFDGYELSTGTLASFSEGAADRLIALQIPVSV